jgi:exonuclease VII large subunit
MTDVDPITQLAERLTMERALREQSERFLADDLKEFRAEIQRRLGELNHAHAQAVETAARTVPRDLFDQFVKENEQRREQSFSALGARLEASIDNVKQTHRVAFDALMARLTTSIEGLQSEIEVERNARIRAEGSVSVWRFIAVFLGFPGIVALILAAVALVGPS